MPGLTREGDREASPPERGNESVPWSGLQTELLERTPEKKPNAEPSTKEGIEAARLCASLLRPRLSINTVSLFFPRNVNNPG
jgi:hypothetical protein